MHAWSLCFRTDGLDFQHVEPGELLILLFTDSYGHPRNVRRVCWLIGAYTYPVPSRVSLFPPEIVAGDVSSVLCANCGDSAQEWRGFRQQGVPAVCTRIAAP